MIGTIGRKLRLLGIGAALASAVPLLGVVAPAANAAPKARRPPPVR